MTSHDSLLNCVAFIIDVSLRTRQAPDCRRVKDIWHSPGSIKMAKLKWLIFLLGGISLISDNCTACLFGNSADCVFQCHCANNAACNVTTGQCPGQCEAGLPQPRDDVTRYDWRGPACQIGNVALNKKAEQSGVWGGLVAGNAVDGILGDGGNGGNANCAHPDADSGSPAWWRVDLGSIHAIHNVTVFNSHDAGAYSRMEEFDIGVGNTTNVTEHTLCASYGSSVVAAGGDVTLICNSPLYGRYVSFRRTGGQQPHLVTICEFVVMGYKQTYGRETSSTTIKTSTSTATASTTTTTTPTTTTTTQTSTTTISSPSSSSSVPPVTSSSNAPDMMTSTLFGSKDCQKRNDQQKTIVALGVINALLVIVIIVGLPVHFLQRQRINQLSKKGTTSTTEDLSYGDDYENVAMSSSPDAVNASDQEKSAGRADLNVPTISSINEADHSGKEQPYETLNNYGEVNGEYSRLNTRPTN